MFNQRNQSNPLAGLPPNGIFEFGPVNIKYKILDDITQEILSVENLNGWEIRGLIPADCGDYCTVDTNLKKDWPLIKGNSYTGQLACFRHLKICRLCGRVLCIAGNVDGLFLERENSTGWWLCLDCHDKEFRKQRTNQILRGLARGLRWRLPE